MYTTKKGDGEVGEEEEEEEDRSIANISVETMKT